MNNKNFEESLTKFPPQLEQKPKRNLIFLFISVFFATMATAWALIQAIQWFLNIQLLSLQGIMGFLVFALFAGIVALVNVLIYLYQYFKKARELRSLSEDRFETILTIQLNKLEEIKSQESQLRETLIEDIEKAYEDENWEKVIKIGSVLSRPLWVTGKYSLRVKLGKLVESAAASTAPYRDHSYEQASALIDDLGWTLYTLDKVEEALQNIKHGIDIAIAKNHNFIAYKGFRHLSGITQEIGQLEEAERYNDKAIEFSEKIDNEYQRKEAIAGLHYNAALLAEKNQNYEKAIEELEVALQLYRELNDKDREVKVNYSKGDVLFKLNEIASAKDVYRQGLTEAKQSSRQDAILYNLIGLAKIAEYEKEPNEAKKLYQDAADIADELGKVDLAKQLRTNI